MENPQLETKSGLTITFKPTLNGYDFFLLKKKFMTEEGQKLDGFYSVLFENMSLFVESIKDDKGGDIAPSLDILKQMNAEEVNALEKRLMALWSKIHGKDGDQKKG